MSNANPGLQKHTVTVVITCSNIFNFRNHGIPHNNHVLPPFYNVSHSSIFHIYIDTNESRHI